MSATAAPLAARAAPIGSEDPWPAARRAWWAVAVLTIAYFFSFIDRQILNLLVAPIRRDLGISDTQMSLLMGVSFASFYTLFGLPIGRLADRVSRRGLIAAGMVLWSVMTALCGLAASFPLLFLCRMGVGVGEAALSPSAYSMIADLFPPARRAQALSVYAAGIYLGGGAAFVIGGVMQGLSAASVVAVPFLGLVRPWQAIFLAVGLPGLLAAALLATVREPERRGPGAGVGQVPVREVVAFLRTHARTFAAHHVGFGLMSLGGYAVISWGPTVFIRHFAWTPAETGVSFGIMGVVTGIAGALSGGRAVTWLEARGHGGSELRVGVAAAVACALLYALFPLIANGRGAFGVLSLAQFFSACPWGIAAAAITRVVPNVMRAQVSALYLLAINLVGLGLGPTLVALLTDRVFGRDDAVHLSLLVVSASAYVLAALALWSGWDAFEGSAARLAAWRPRAIPPDLRDVPT